MSHCRFGESVDEFVDDLDDGGLQPCGGTGRERLGDQSPEPMVFGAVEAQQAGDDPVPQWSVGDALGRKTEPRRHAEPRVAEHRVDQFVGEHLGSVRPERDGCLPPGLPEHGVGDLGVLDLLIVDGGSPASNTLGVDGRLSVMATRTPRG